MVAEFPSDDDFLFDEAGWLKNLPARRYELTVLGEVVAAIAFEEVRLHQRTDGSDYVENVIAQGADLKAERETQAERLAAGRITHPES